ncbi:hypothetical protein CP03DC29_0797B, partial [Chlamydia psittaci 03DC29]
SSFPKALSALSTNCINFSIGSILLP